MISLLLPHEIKILTPYSNKNKKEGQQHLKGQKSIYLWIESIMASGIAVVLRVHKTLAAMGFKVDWVICQGFKVDWVICQVG